MPRRTIGIATILTILSIGTVVSLPGLSAADATVKPVITGLLDRKGMPSSAYVPRLDGFVVLVSWADLQPTAFGPIAQGNAIDRAVAAVRTTPGASHLRLKLRVLSGIDAPAWAKDLAGGPVKVYHGRKLYTLGKFWTPAFGAAYEDLQAKLAARYDAEPEVVEVVISRCTVMTAEPFLRAVRPDTRTMESMVAGGYTANTDEVCQREEIDAHRVWTTTRAGLTLDPYDRLLTDATAVQDEAFTEQMMDYCRRTLGTRCVLENNAVAAPLLPEPYPTMYRAITTRGAPIGYQTRNAQRIGDWYQALTWSAEEGANHVELNITYPTYDKAQLEAARVGLKANPTGTDTGG